MANGRIGRLGWLAIGLAIVGGVVALVNEFLTYRRTNVVDWGHLALAFGVPIFMYAVVRSSTSRKP